LRKFTVDDLNIKKITFFQSFKYSDNELVVDMMSQNVVKLILRKIIKDRFVEAFSKLLLPDLLRFFAL